METAVVSNKVKTALEDVKKAFEDVVEKETYAYGDSYTLTQEKADEYAAQIEKNLGFDSEEKYADLTVTIAAVSNKTVKSSNIQTSITVTNTEKVDDSATDVVNIPIDLVDAGRVKDALEAVLDVDGIKPVYSTADSDVTKKVQDAVDNAMKNIDSIADEYLTNFRATANLVDGESSEFDGTKTWTYTIKVENTKATSEDTAEIKDITFSADETEQVTDASEALSYLQENLKEVTVPAGTDISITGKADADAITDAVKAAAEETWESSEYNELGTKNATLYKIDTPQMVGHGVWKSEVTVKVGNKTASGYLTVNLTTDAKEEDTVVKMELVEAEDEVEVGSVLANNIKGIKLYYESNKTEVVGIDAADRPFTYDTTSWNTSKLGETSVTFISKNADTPVSVTYTAKVVSSVTYTNDNRTPGSSQLAEDLEDVIGLKTEYLDEVTSDNTDVLQVAFDEEKGTVTFKGCARGTATVTALGKAGRVIETKIQVAANGDFKIVSSEEVVAKRYISADKLGFEPHASNSKNKVTLKDEKVEDWTSDHVVEAEIVTVGEQEMISINPLAEGEVTIVVTGGDKGQLEATFKVNVDENKYISISEYQPEEFKANTISLNKSATEKVQNLNVTAEDTLEVEDLGFDSNDKINLETADGKLDTVPAEDITKVEVLSENGTATGIGLTYYGQTFKMLFEETGKSTVSNNVTVLGLKGEKVKEIKNNPAADELIEDVEFTTNAKGEAVIIITPVADTKEGTATIVVEDALENTASIIVKITDGKIVNTDVEPFDMEAADWNLTAPTKKLYTLGETVDLEGGYIKSETAEGKEVKIQLTEDMITGFDTSKATLNSDGSAIDYTQKEVTVAYGGINKTFVYGVKPASKTVSVSSLGLASGETVVSVANRGDVSISSSLNDKKDTLTIVATKTEQSGSAVITTNKGRTVSVKIDVDEEGTITTSVVEKFESSIAVVENTEDVLGLVATEAESSNEAVAVASIAGNKVVITSVGRGNATITVKTDDAFASIPVSVDEFGTITIGDIVKANSNGWVRGEGSDWYYYINGEKVTNDWVAVVEADPYNNNEVGKVWYHFDKDGKMQRGWIKDESGWKIYNLDSNGRMRHDMWINAEANEELGMPTGIYHLLSDGAAQMNGWAESITEGIYWFCAPNSGVFDASNPANWATSMPN